MTRLGTALLAALIAFGVAAALSVPEPLSHAPAASMEATGAPYAYSEEASEMETGDIVTVNWPGNALHGKKVTIDRIDPAMDIAHPDCPNTMLVEMIFVAHPSLPQPIGIGRERLR